MLCSCSRSMSSSADALPNPTGVTWYQSQLLTPLCDPIQPSIQPKRQATPALALSSHLHPLDAHLARIIRTIHRHLVGLPLLTSVSEPAGETEVSCWYPLSHLPYLEKLVVDASAATCDNSCTVYRLEQLAPCSRLCSLELRGCELGAWSALRSLQRLRQLRLQDCTQDVPGDLMRQLRPLTQLEVLQVQVGIL